MKSKLNVLVAAVAALAAAGAQAAITTGQSTQSNSSVLFIAWDTTNRISLTVDMGVNMTDFLSAASFVNTTGALAGAGTAATWDFSANSRTLNGSSVAGDYGWSSAFSDFQSAAGTYTWAVVAGDNASSAISATNPVFNRNVLSTGTPTQANINSLTASTNMSNAPARFETFAISSNGQGNHGTVADGANTSTSGQSYVGTVMSTGFGSSGGITWNYMSAVGATTNFFLTQQASNPVVYQIGGGSTSGYGAVDTLLSASDAATFTFDGTTLSYAVAPVPEPGTYGLLLAGLAGVGLMVRRRTRG